MENNRSELRSVIFDGVFYLTLLVLAGAISYFLWAFSMVMEQYVKHTSLGIPQPSLTNLFFRNRLVLLLFPVPWLLFAMYSIFAGPRSTRALVFYSSTLIFGTMTISVIAAVAFALPWIKIIKS